MLEELLCASNKVVGTKQTKRCLERGEVLKVYLASDADLRLKTDILNECELAKVDVVLTDTMEDLGNACGINVKAAVAALLKD